MMWDHMAEHGWGWGLMGVGMLLFWMLIILAIVALVKWLRTPQADASPREKTALAILQERYARGEIDREEYQQKKADLER